MTIPSLDKFLGNPNTGKLKEVMPFIVDNRPPESPSCFLVQMLLVCLLKFLNLDKVTQRAFAEYLSKRKCVERFHAIENRALCGHGPFSAKKIHKTVSPGSEDHTVNMEHMASKVIKCVGKAVYNKEAIECCRGIGANDEGELKSLSLLSDEGRREEKTTYGRVRNRMLDYVWHVKKNVKGCYSEDYCTLTLTTTACVDKYIVSVSHENEDWTSWKPLESFDCQPLPDYRQWDGSGELHDLGYEARRDFPRGL